MSLPERFKNVTFNYGGERLQLTLGGEIVRKGGVQGDMFTATIAAAERVKLPAFLIEVIGSIELWWSSDPAADGAEPDVVLGGIHLVDCVATDFGYFYSNDELSVVEYQLSFCDFRHAFSEPRGGRLTGGLGNPDPLGDATLIDCQTLMNDCLNAMGVTGGAPASVNDTDPPRNIEYYGAHAPSEFNRLLQHTGHVFVPLLAGGGVVQQVGTGDLPSPPSNRLIASLTVPGVPRLSQIAIFYGAPNAVVRTYDENVSNDAAPEWEFVAQDPSDGKYKALADISALGSNPLTTVRKGFAGVSAAYVKQLNDQCYKLIRLKSDRFNRLQCPILRDVLRPDGTKEEPYLILSVALQGNNNARVNTPNVKLKAKTVDGQSQILAFDERLGTVSAGTSTSPGSDGAERADLDPFFSPVDPSSIKPGFSVEDFDDGKVYACYGFEMGVLSASPISESAARSNLSGYRPNVAIYSCGELRFIWLNDTTGNGDELAAHAQGLATALLNANPDPRIMRIAGFYPVQLNGRVSEVRYSQDPMMTTVVCDGWACPAGGGPPLRHPARKAGSGGSAGASDATAGTLVKPTARTYPVAKEQARGMQIEQGGSMSRAIHQPVQPGVPGATGGKIITAAPTAKIAGRRFSGRTFSGKFSRNTTGDFTQAELGTKATADDCEIRGGNTGFELQIGIPYICTSGGVNDDGKLLLFAGSQLNALFLVKLKKDGGSDGGDNDFPSFTYSIYNSDDSISTGTPIATKVPALQRELPLRHVAAADGSPGIAAVVDGAWLILVFGEKLPSVSPCNTSTGTGVEGATGTGTGTGE